jgi:nucleoside-diphosphate-sugar epimerase
MTAMRVLVTGGAGYVGSTLVPVLLAEGHHVRVLDRLRAGGEGLLGCCAHAGFELVVGDVCDERAVAAALRGVDAIVHLAAVVGQPACAGEPAQAWMTNVEGTSTIVKLRQPGQSLLFASTGSVYGKVTDAVCTESTSVDPNTQYAKAKAVGEQLVLDAGNAVVYRFATAFGVSQRLRTDLLVNDFVYKAVRQGYLVVYQPAFRRTLVHVRDMARSIAFALRSWHVLADDVYNVGNAALNMSKADIAGAIARRTDCYVHFAEFATDPDQRDYAVSYRKIEDKGFTAEVDLETGLAELCGAARLLP